MLELWGLGDLAIAARFLCLAAERYEVTLLAKPTAIELNGVLWPRVEIIPFAAPWTAFRRKYHLHRWDWPALRKIGKEMRARKFDHGVSVRPDPRDHLLLAFSRAQARVGFETYGSSFFLTQVLGAPTGHRYEHWRAIGRRLGFEVPVASTLPERACASDGTIIIHSGAGKDARVWPVPRCASLVRRLRERGFKIRVACDASQYDDWAKESGEIPTIPQSVTELIHLLRDKQMFIGNDSGPGHLAAGLGIPTFTIFGPSHPEAFAPVHPQAQWVDGKPCIYKPCRDYCRFREPYCITTLQTEEVWRKIEVFVYHHLKGTGQN